MTAHIKVNPDTGHAPKDYALMYAGLGWKVFPVWSIRTGMLGDSPAGVCLCPQGAQCDRPGKHPIGDLVPSGASDATTERAKIEAWWGRYPQASIGIATGAVSDLTVIDADASGGKPGLINLTRLCAPNGGVPLTLTVETGGGGLHLYFKYNAALRTGSNVLAEALDVRNDGGYCVAAPSNHKSGGVYKWREEQGELLALPEWMINAPRETAERTTRRRGRPRTREALPLEQVESMLTHIDPDDRDHWLKMGLLLGKLYVGSEAEGEAWAVYETWAARSDKFEENRAGNIARMRQQFDEYSQAPVRAGQMPLGTGTLYLWAKEGGWSPFGERATIRLETGNESAMAEALVEALVADPETNRFFNIMGEVRDVTRCITPSLRLIQKADAEGEAPPETLIVRKTTLPALRSALSEKAVLVTTSANGVPVAKGIPDDLLNIALKDKAQKFPPLAGIAEWPMVSGGRMLYRARGYDPGIGLYFDIDARVQVDESLTAEAGWRWLCEEFLVDFPFEDETHRAGALAMMLAMMQRALMETCPAFAVVAPQPGTGKTTLIEVSALAILGTPAIPHAFSSDEEEIRKALHSLMISKAPVVMFDNVGRGRAVSSDHLAKMITSEIAADRTLGSSETRTEVNSLLMTFTGNNITFVRDLSTRVVTVRMNARSVNPIGRSFRHPGIRAWARANRNAVLSALVAIAKLADGETVPGAASRFTDYDWLIVGPVLKVTGEDVRMLNVNENVDSEEDEGTRDALAAMWRWQREQRGADDNGKPWRTRDVVAGISVNGYPAADAAVIRRFAGDERDWENDAVRTLAYALRAVRDDYSFSPYLLTKTKVEHNQAYWLVKNAEAEAPAPRTEAF